jgi:uncharacterized protein YggT (Ycf19 family)
MSHPLKIDPYEPGLLDPHTFRRLHNIALLAYCHFLVSPMAAHHLVRFVSFYTDPYLNLFRRLLPPLGGVLDISPILGFFALRIAEMILLGLIQ